MPQSSVNPFRCHGAQQGHPDKAQNFLAALHAPSSLAGTGPWHPSLCKEQHVLTRFIWALSYPGDDQNSPESGLFPAFPGETAPHYYEFRVTLVPSRLPGLFLCQNCSELKDEHLGLNSGGFKLRLSLELRQSPPHLLLPLALAEMTVWQLSN